MMVLRCCFEMMVKVWGGGVQGYMMIGRWARPTLTYIYLCICIHIYIYRYIYIYMYICIYTCRSTIRLKPMAVSDTRTFESNR